MRKGILALIAVLMWSFTTEAHVVPPKQIHKKIFDCIANEQDHPGLSDVTKAYLCLMVRETNIRFVTITSSCRGKSFHHKSPTGECLAVDFYPNNYTGKDRDDAQLYEDYLFEIAEFLDNHPWLDKISGLGIYVSGCGKPGASFRGKFIFHFDVRGRRARWGQIGSGKYVSIEAALDSHWTVLDQKC